MVFQDIWKIKFKKKKIKKLLTPDVTNNADSISEQEISYSRLYT